MQTIKTAVVVVMLLAVLYGGYVALNGTDTPLPPELERMANLDLDFQDGLSTPDSTTYQPGGFFVQSTPNSGATLPSNPTAGNSFPAPSLNPDPGMASNTSPGFTPPTLPSSNSSVAGGSTQVPTLPGSSFSPPNASTTSNNLPLLPPTLSNQTNSTASSNGLNTPTGSSLSNTTATTNGNRPSPFPPLTNSLAQSGSTPSSSTSTNTLDIPNVQTPSTPSNDTLETPTTDFPSPPSLSVNPKSNDLASDPSADEVDSSSDESKPKGLANSTTSRSFENAKKMAMEQISRRELKEALGTLSLFYNAPELTHEQFQDLLGILDALAGEVIYSRNHYLELPHVVAQGETLEEIAKQYEIPADILGKINAIADPNAISPGTKLKIVPGPFRAEVSVERSELTLFVGDLYAGRFAVEIGANPAPKEGIFQVVEKQKNRNYYGAGGTQLAGNDPRNPYGGLWIDLGGDLCIHGTPEQPTADFEKMGCISLSPIDASDVFGMLSRGSKVQIRR